MIASLSFAGLLVLVSGAAGATPAQKPTPEEMRAAFEAHKGDFDYLLGDWRFSAESREHGRFQGFWSAVKLADGQILDEYRVAGQDGGTIFLMTTIRNYNRVVDRWDLSLIHI